MSSGKRDEQVLRPPTAHHTCPHCAKPLESLRHSVTTRHIYFCLRHGKFWIDDDGRVREDRRAIPRANS
jgi:hypothetical protein